MILNKRTDRIPSDAVYVGRPSPFGNPFPVSVGGRAEAIQKYKAWIIKPEQAALRDRMRRELRGKSLVCWCAPLPCHAEVVAFIAATEQDPTNK